MGKTLFYTTTFLILLINTGFKVQKTQTDWLNWTNHCLAQSYNSAGDPKLKKWEITVTSDNFLRLRKTYVKSKQVYFSFNLKKLSNILYLGNTKKGILKLKAVEDDIIEQTRNYRKGDVDEMVSELDVPVKNMEPERLDSLKVALNYFKEKGL